MIAGWVYVLEAIGLSVFKIGRTSDEPESRMSQLKTGCPNGLRVLIAFTCSDSERFEKMLQDIVGENGGIHLEGEWYAFPREAMLEVLMHLFAGIGRGAGLIDVRSSSLELTQKRATS